MSLVSMPSLTFKTTRALTVFSVSAAILILTSACQTIESTKSQDRKSYQQTLKDSSFSSQVERGPKTRMISEAPTNPMAEVESEQTSSQLGFVPELSTEPNNQGDKGSGTPKIKAKKIDAFVRPLSVPEFIDAVFGSMLEAPYVTGPNVATMTDIVQMRSSGEIEASNFLALVSGALEQYGVRVVPENGAYQIIQDAALRARIPTFIKSRARQRTRGDLRPVIQFVELQAVSAGSMLGFLKDAFPPTSGKLAITSNPQTNYITLTGLPDDVEAALVIIRQLDELNYAGSQVRRISPRYWNATELSVALKNALGVEGWQVTNTTLLVRTIALLPIEYSNDLFVFTKSEEAFRRVTKWVEELDRPVNSGDAEQIFIYQVRNVDASLLSETANAVLSGTQSPAETTSNANTGATNNTQSIARRAGGKFTVDRLGNRIVFTGTTSEYDKLINLLEKLDTPAPEVLIEVQIAEVTLNDSTNTGVELLINDLGGSQVQGTVQTTGLGKGSSGLNIGIISGNVDASINALASNRQVKVLSTPVLVARSGGSAQIQVGSDVPIITSQGAANNQNGSGTTDILQTVQYRSTGVLLSIEPIVFSDNRIDLTISQEVSSTLDVSNSAISSPTISNRTINTQLSLEDGATAVLGGLIQENTVRDNKGIPFLKDIPWFGKAVSTDNYSVDRTELVILITAYVLRGQPDKQAFVNHMRNRVDGYLADQSRLMTLEPKGP